jgi:hypothetical protein
VRGDDHARPLRRIGKLCLDDRRQCQVAERAVPVPALVAALSDLDLGPGGRIEIRQGRQPVDARESVTGATAALRVEEMVGERLRVRG